MRHTVYLKSRKSGEVRRFDVVAASFDKAVAKAKRLARAVPAWNIIEAQPIS